jgi:hypothetical protein
MNRQLYGVIDSLDAGVKWLIERREGWGGWKSRLSSDAIASACAYRVIADMQPTRACNIHDNLGKWIRINGDQLVKGDSLDQLLITSLLEPHCEHGKRMIQTAVENATHPSAPLAALFGCLVEMTLPSSVDAILPKGYKEWRDLYGPHWAIYALLGDILRADESGCTEVELLLRQLVLQRSSTGCWHGDVILTSAAVLVLRHLNRDWSTQMDATTWLSNLAGKRTDGMPLVSGLEIWDTAWALDAIMQEDIPVVMVEQGAEWLARCHRTLDTLHGWSWSEEGTMICCDSTSLVCNTLRQARVKDVYVEAILMCSIKSLESLCIDGYRWPTFVDRDKGLHPCPIISSRCLSLSTQKHINLRSSSERILSDVFTNAWISEWFSERTITQGLVLSNLAGLGGFDQAAMAHSISEVSDDVLQGRITVEGAAAMLLGLTSLRSDTPSVYDQQIKTLKDFLILSRSSCDMWKAAPIGYFGFGRCYSDDIFTTSLATIALRSYRRYSQ